MKNIFYPQSFFHSPIHYLAALVFCFALFQSATTDAQEPVFKAPEQSPFGLSIPDEYDGAIVKLVDLNHDGTLEAITSLSVDNNMSQEVQYFENEESDEAPEFVFEISAPFGIPIGDNRPFQFVDIDGDNDEDLFFVAIVHYPNPVHMIENTGSDTVPDFSNPFQLNPYGISLPESDMDGSLLDGAVPAFADIDNDGDFDLFLGGAFDNGTPQLPDEALFFLENSGTPTQPQFDTIVKNPFGFVLPAGTVYHWEIFADLDCDGDLDMYLASPQSSVFYFENTGTPELPDFSSGEVLSEPAAQGFAFNPPAGSFLDIGGDGDLDLISGSPFSGIQFFENLDTVDCLISSIRKEEVLPAVSLAPNPVQNELQLTILSTVNLGNNISLQIFDLTGKQIFAKDLGTAGSELSEVLDVGQLPPGVYLLKIGLGEQSLTQKFLRQ